LAHETVLIDFVVIWAREFFWTSVAAPVLPTFTRWRHQFVTILWRYMQGLYKSWKIMENQLECSGLTMYIFYYSAVPKRKHFGSRRIK